MANTPTLNYFSAVNKADITESVVVGKQRLYSDNIKHRKSAILIETFGGGLLIAKINNLFTKENKLTFPVITHVRTVESYQDAAIRAAKSKLNIIIIDPTELPLLLKCQPHENTHNAFVYLYSYLIDPELESFKFGEDEISELRIVNRKELTKDILSNPELYSKEFKILYNMFITLNKTEEAK